MLFPQFASTAYSNLGVSLLGRTLEKATGGAKWDILREVDFLTFEFQYWPLMKKTAKELGGEQYTILKLMVSPVRPPRLQKFSVKGRATKLAEA